MAPISFDLIPANLRVPGVFVEFDATQAVREVITQPPRGNGVGGFVNG